MKKNIINNLRNGLESRFYPLTHIMIMVMNEDDRLRYLIRLRDCLMDIGSPIGDTTINVRDILKDDF